MKLLSRVKLPVVYSAGSFLCLLVLMALTSPGQNIILSAAFFVLLLIFLTSTGYLITSLKSYGGAKKRHRVVIISLFIVITLMFMSSQTFDWVDGLILILSVIGFIFYADRRFARHK